MTGRHLEHDWHPDPVPGNVVLGEGAWLYSSWAFAHFRATAADAVAIGAHSGVYVGSMFVLGPAARVRVGDWCVLNGPIIATEGRVEIGDHALISYGVVLAGDAAAAPGAEGGGDIVIGDDVWIGANAVVLGGARIGDGAIIGARTVVTGHVPAGATVVGNPACVVRRSQPRGAAPRRRP